ncbi:hypothetical protein H9P43_001679 [Blastocladiella emersonii ATCC 22665]|nr:hypothetical protein H9P43_001679 [Blastocladiella emersonii ATCC 22665]
MLAVIFAAEGSETAELLVLAANFLASVPGGHDAGRVLLESAHDGGLLPRTMDYTGQYRSQTPAELLRNISAIQSTDLVGIAQKWMQSNALSSLLAAPPAPERERMPMSMIQKLRLRQSHPGHRVTLAEAMGKYEEIGTLFGHTFEVLCMAFDRTQRRIITGSNDWSVKVWCAESGWLLYTLRGHLAEVEFVTVNRENTMIATAAGDGTVRVWDLRTGMPVATLRTTPPPPAPVVDGPAAAAAAQATNRVTAVLWSPSPHPENRFLLAATRNDATVRIWRWERPAAAAGANAAAAAGPGHFPDPDHPLEIPVRTLPHTYPVCLGIDPTGLHIAIGGSDGILRLHSTRPLIEHHLARADTVPIPVLPPFPAAAAADAMDVDPAETQNSGDAMQVDDVPPALPPLSLDTIPCVAHLRHTGPLADVHFSNKGDRILSASEEGLANIWTLNPATGEWESVLLQAEPIHEPDAAAAAATDTAARPSSAAGADGSQAAAAKRKRRRKPRYHVTVFCWLVGDDYVVTSNADGYIRVYESQHGELVHAMRGDGQSSTGGNAPAAAVAAMTPGGGEHIAAYAEDEPFEILTLEPHPHVPDVFLSATYMAGHVALWHRSQSAPVWTRTLNGVVGDARFSPDGWTFLVSEYHQELDPTGSQVTRVYAIGRDALVAPVEQFFTSDFDQIDTTFAVPTLYGHNHPYHEEHPQLIRPRNSDVYPHQPPVAARAAIPAGLPPHALVESDLAVAALLASAAQQLVMAESAVLPPAVVEAHAKSVSKRPRSHAARSHHHHHHHTTTTAAAGASIAANPAAAVSAGWFANLAAAGTGLPPTGGGIGLIDFDPTQMTMIDNDDSDDGDYEEEGGAGHDDDFAPAAASSSNRRRRRRGEEYEEEIAETASDELVYAEFGDDDALADVFDQGSESSDVDAGFLDDDDDEDGSSRRRTRSSRRRTGRTATTANARSSSRGNASSPGPSTRSTRITRSSSGGIAQRPASSGNRQSSRIRRPSRRHRETYGDDGIGTGGLEIDPLELLDDELEANQRTRGRRRRLRRAHDDEDDDEVPAPAPRRPGLRSRSPPPRPPPLPRAGARTRATTRASSASATMPPPAVNGRRTRSSRAVPTDDDDDEEDVEEETPITSLATSPEPEPTPGPSSARSQRARRRRALESDDDDDDHALLGEEDEIAPIAELANNGRRHSGSRARRVVINDDSDARGESGEDVLMAAGSSSSARPTRSRRAAATAAVAAISALPPIPSEVANGGRNRRGRRHNPDTVPVPETQAFHDYVDNEEEGSDAASEEEAVPVPPPRASRNRALSSSSTTTLPPAPAPATTARGRTRRTSTLPPATQVERYPDWMTATETDEFAYYPQAGDRVVVFMDGYRRFLDAAKDAYRSAGAGPGGNSPYASQRLHLFGRVDHLVATVSQVNVERVVRGGGVVAWVVALHVVPDGEPGPPRVLVIKYEDLGMPDFVVLESRFRHAVAMTAEIQIADTIRVVADKGERWDGTVIDVKSDSEWEKFAVQWDDEDEDSGDANGAVSPWELDLEGASRSSDEYLPPAIRDRATATLMATRGWPQPENIGAVVPNVPRPASVILLLARLQGNFYRHPAELAADLGRLLSSPYSGAADLATVATVRELQRSVAAAAARASSSPALGNGNGNAVSPSFRVRLRLDSEAAGSSSSAHPAPATHTEDDVVHSGYDDSESDPPAPAPAPTTTRRSARTASSSSTAAVPPPLPPRNGRPRRAASHLVAPTPAAHAAEFASEDELVSGFTIAPRRRTSRRSLDLDDDEDFDDDGEVIPAPKKRKRAAAAPARKQPSRRRAHASDEEDDEEEYDIVGDGLDEDEEDEDPIVDDSDSDSDAYSDGEGAASSRAKRARRR